MIKYENQCCDCQKPCIQEACPYYKVKIKICDQCGDECDMLYYSPVDNKELCEDCVLDTLEIVEAASAGDL